MPTPSKNTPNNKRLAGFTSVSPCLYFVCEEYKLLADRMNGNKDREEARFRQQLAIQNAQVDAVEQTNDILRGQEQFRGVS